VSAVTAVLVALPSGDALLQLSCASVRAGPGPLLPRVPPVPTGRRGEPGGEGTQTLTSFSPFFFEWIG